MESRMVAVAISVILVVLGGGLVLSGFANVGQTSDSSPNVTGVPPQVSTPVTLNSVAYVEQVVGDKVVLPDPSALGASYRIVGATVALRPTLDTISGGPTYRHWILDFYIANSAFNFVNGSTVDSSLTSNSIVVIETTSTGAVGNYTAAVNFLQPGESCAITTQASGSVSTSTCQQLQGDRGNLIQIRGTYLAVNPSVPNAYFQLDGAGRVIQIYPASYDSTIISYQQLLALAGSMIPQTTSV